MQLARAFAVLAPRATEHLVLSAKHLEARVLVVADKHFLGGHGDGGRCLEVAIALAQRAPGTVESSLDERRGQGERLCRRSRLRGTDCRAGAAERAPEQGTGSHWLRDDTLAGRQHDARGRDGRRRRDLSRNPGVAQLAETAQVTRSQGHDLGELLQQRVAGHVLVAIHLGSQCVALSPERDDILAPLGDLIVEVRLPAEDPLRAIVAAPGRVQLQRTLGHAHNTPVMPMHMQHVPSTERMCEASHVQYTHGRLGRLCFGRLGRRAQSSTLGQHLPLTI